jgi:hypothetical protein
MLAIAAIRADILKFLQSFFGEGRLSDPVDGSILFKYDEDEEKTELIIRAKNLIQDSELGRKPLIVLDRGTITFQKSSLNQMEDYDPRTGTGHYMDIMTIPVVLHCVSPSDEEAELLGLITALSFFIHKDAFKPPWLHDLNLNALTSPGILINESQGEGSAVYVVSVNVTFYAHVGFHRREAAEVLRSFNDPIVTEIVDNT